MKCCYIRLYNGNHFHSNEMELEHLFDQTMFSVSSILFFYLNVHKTLIEIKSMINNK